MKEEVFGKNYSGYFGTYLGTERSWSDICYWLSQQDTEIPLPEDKRQPNLTQCSGIIVEHHQKGERNYEKQLTKYLKTDPDYTDGYLQRATEYLKLEKYEQAFSDFEKYLEITKRELIKYNNPECQKYILISGRRANCYLDIARIKNKQNKHPYEVIKCLLKAVAEAPDLREAWTYLADGYMAVKNYPAAYGAAMNALLITNSGIHPQEMICWGDYPKQIADTAFARILNPKK